MNVYRIDRPAAAVTAGVLVVGAALAAFVAFLLTSVVATVVAVVLLVLAALLMLRPPVVARLDETGLRSRGQSVVWKDVEDVSFGDGTVRLVRADDSVVALNLGAVGRRAPELLREVHDRLNTANGYRRFDPGA